MASVFLAVDFSTPEYQVSTQVTPRSEVGVRYAALERGDVVVAREPGGGAFVKRVIAVPGGIVEIDGAGPHPVVLIQPRWQRSMAAARGALRRQ